MAAGLNLRREIPNGTVPLKEPSVPQNRKYERMGQSPVLLWHVGKWWEKGSCCKNGDGSSLSSMTPEQDFKGEVTKNSSYSHACNSPGRDLAVWGAEHVAAPPGSWWAGADSDIWRLTFLNCFGALIGIPSLANITVVGGVWLAVLGQRGSRSAVRAVPAPSECSERTPWALPPRCLLDLLGRAVHLVTQHDHCLSLGCLMARQHSYVKGEPVLALPEETWLKS